MAIQIQDTGLSTGLTDALGGDWVQHSQDYYRIPPDANGKVLKKIRDANGKVIGTERVDAPDFMQWGPGQGPFQAVAKNLRDFLQSSMAWGVPIEELTYVTELLDYLGLYAIAKTGGGAMKQVADKNLEYGWQNLATIAEFTPNTPGEALGREDCIVSYGKCPPDVTDAYYKLLSRHGVLTNRAFTGSNNHEDDKNPYAATLTVGMRVQGEITYPVKKMSTEWWVEQALRKVDMGATSIGIKDGTGRMQPEEARDVVTVLRKALPSNVRIVMHCQSTVGISPATYKAGLEAGADSIHVVVGGWAAQRGAFPGLVSMQQIMKGTDRESEYDQVITITRANKRINVTQELDREMRRILEKFPYLLGSNQAVEERTIDGGSPGGGLAAYEVWLKEQTPPADGLFDAVLAKQRETLAMMGWPCSITPYYKIACDQALQNVRTNNGFSNQLLSREIKWEDIPEDKRAEGNWKFFTPEFRLLLKGGYGRMPADDYPELLTESEGVLRASLQQRVLREDLESAIIKLNGKMKKGDPVTISDDAAQKLRNDTEKLLEIGRTINELYEPTRVLRQAEGWVSDTQNRLEESAGNAELTKHFAARFREAEERLISARKLVTESTIGHDEYVAFMKTGKLSDKMLAIVEGNGISTEIPTDVLGSVLKEGTYIACPPTDILEPRMEKYRGEVRKLIEKGTHIGPIHKAEDIAKHQEVFEEAAVYAAMYVKEGGREGLNLLKAFDVKERLTRKGVLPGNMAEEAVKKSLLAADDPALKKLKDYDTLKLNQAIQAPANDNTEKILKAKAELAQAEGKKDEAKGLALQLIQARRKLPEAVIERIKPYAVLSGELRFKELTSPNPGSGTVSGGLPKRRASSRENRDSLVERQAELAQGTTRILATELGFTPPQIAAVVPIFNDIARAKMRQLRAEEAKKDANGPGSSTATIISSAPPPRRQSKFGKDNGGSSITK